MFALALMIGCKSEPAPAELDDLTRYMFREIEDEDRREAAAISLDSFISGQVDLAASLVDRSYTLPDPEPGDIGGITHPDRDLEPLIGVGIFWEGPHDIDAHAQYIVWEDQLPLNPTAEWFIRTFPEEDDPECFARGECEYVLTVNDIRRVNAAYSVTYQTLKQFYWVELPDERRAVLARAWFEQPWDADDGGTLYQSYEVDVWMESPSGGTYRYYAGWTESDVTVAGDDVILALVRSTTQERYEVEDEAAAGL